MAHYIKLERVFLQNHPDLDERWVQARIAEDPAILGLGDLILKDKERNQPRAGRLDLLLQEPESNRRCEVEVQLGLGLLISLPSYHAARHGGGARRPPAGLRSFRRG
ncbi:MAG: hypothetical protein ABSC08_19910 [Bryobacteraceae bacterium]